MSNLRPVSDTSLSQADNKLHVSPVPMTQKLETKGKLLYDAQQNLYSAAQPLFLCPEDNDSISHNLVSHDSVSYRIRFC